MVKTAEAKYYFVTRKEELGYFLDTFMGAALYFCSVFDGRENRVLKCFVKFFLCAARVFCLFVLFFPEERSGTRCCKKSNWTFWGFFGY